MELTEKKSILENEKEGLLKKLNEEEEVRDRVLREARLQESKGLNDKLERYERNFQELIGEKSLLQEKLIITEEKLRVLQERLFSNEREKKVMQDKIQLKKESYINEYKKELKEVLYLEGNSLKDLKLMTKIFIHTLEVLSRISYNSMPHSLMQLKEELIHKKEEIWQRFNQNYEEFSQMLSNFKNKYDINLDIEDLSISNLTINYEKNNKSISEISQKSIKNYDSGTIKKDKNHEENIEMMIYLQACSLENMLEQLQNNESQLDERNHTEEDKNNISLINSDLEKINEMNEDDETHTQLSNQSLKI